LSLEYTLITTAGTITSNSFTAKKNLYFITAAIGIALLSVAAILFFNLHD
jgi:hypothetical protein